MTRRSRKRLDRESSSTESIRGLEQIAARLGGGRGVAVSRPLRAREREALGSIPTACAFVTLEATKQTRREMGGSFARKAPCGDPAHDHTLAKRALCQLS
jgi:hypothetical protein